MPTYRALGPDDLDILFTVGQEFHAESRNYEGLPMDEARTRRVLTVFLDNEMVAVFGAFYAGTLVGFIAAEITPDPWSDRVVAHEHLMYVSPAHRSTGVGRSLANIFIQWANTWGAAIRMTIDSGVDDAKAVHMLEGLGLERRGSIMGREVI
jgi:GNAT superfamily N-acetyltransferase